MTLSTSAPSSAPVAIKGITGTTEECLLHFSESTRFLTLHASDTKSSTHLKYTKICGLFQINPGTVGRRLFCFCEVPLAPDLIKLWYLLRLLGYKITDADVLSGESRNLAESIALGIVSVKEATFALKVCRQSILRWASVKVDLQPKNIVTLKAFLDGLKVESEARREKWIATLRALGFLAGADPSHQVPECSPVR